MYLQNTAENLSQLLLQWTITNNFAIQYAYGLETRLQSNWSLIFLCRRFAAKSLLLLFLYIQNLQKNKKILLRPVAQLYEQVRTDWNQCFVIDCSLSHPAGRKPFTCSHSVLRNTWLNIHTVRWMRFSACLSVHVFTILRNLTWSFFVSSAVSELSSD